MRTCASCGRDNPDDADFCSCGEYLRWEPTGYVKAVATPGDVAAPGSAAETANPPAPIPEDPNLTLAADAVTPREWGSGANLGAGVQAQPGTPGSGDAPPGAAALTLRLPGDESASPGPVNVAVEPGQRVLIVGTIRNQSEVVDNFDMAIRGLPEGWWTITPATAYLVPYGAGGTYEQELQIHLHPPRTPEAQARPWSYEVVAESRAYGGEVVSAPASVEIAPYFDVATELKPERGSGRTKARYRLIVRNKANARTDVALSAEDTDAECQFRFAEPKITLEPGNALECPFTVFPPRQIWLGRPVERRFQVTAAPLDVDLPTPPRMAVYRQKAWLPWWLAIVAPIAIVLALLVIKLLPKQAAVPNVVGLKSVFAAQQLLNKDGFMLAPKTTSAPVTGKNVPGSIAGESPPAGTKAKKGAIITLAVYAGSGQSTVPSLTGDQPGQADQALRAAGLALGAVSPQPLNPNGKISSQIPLPGVKVAGGTTVAVILATATAKAGAGTPAAAGAAKAATAATAAAAAGGAAGAAALTAAAAQAGTGSIVVPAVTGDPATAAGKLAQLGLQPKPLKEVANVPVNMVAGTVPAAGQKVAKGAVVDVLISTGAPELSYDNGQTITVVNPLTSKVSGLVPPAASGTQVEASWSPDGTHVIYSQNGQLVIDRPNVKSAAPFQLTQPQTGVVNVNPAFAPTLKSLVVAYVQRTATSAKLCFATIGRFALNPSCAGAPGWDLGGEVDWSPDGQTVLVFGSRNGGRNFGILAWHSNVAFSSQASNWGTGAIQTTDTTAGSGVFQAQISPSGKQMALVAGSVVQGFSLYIVPAGQFSFTPQQQLPGIQACQVAWRDDGQELAVMQPHGLCGPDAIGTIVAVKPASPGNTTILANQGAHPAWQPVPTGN